MRIVLATQNEHKLGELSRLLEPLGVEVVSPAEIGGLPPVVEDRETFAGNAAKKAVSGASSTGEWTLADDSGLEVHALGGAPGVRSARYAGEDADDAANNEKLLRELAGVPAAERTARFVCALALVRPDGSLVAEIEGQAAGRLLEEPRGVSGFGYDPLFEFAEKGHPQTGRTFAELSGADKSAVSHRGRALCTLASRLDEILQADSGATR